RIGRNGGRRLLLFPARHSPRTHRYQRAARAHARALCAPLRRIARPRHPRPRVARLRGLPTAPLPDRQPAHADHMLRLTMLLRTLRAAALAGAALAMAGPVPAAYPDKPISLVVPFPAGSGTDAVGRIFAAELGNILGQQVVVENKPGANATIAAQYVARAKPDGYTLFVTTNTSHSAVPFLMKNVPYDPVKDFTPIARGGNLPFLLV